MSAPCVVCHTSTQLRCGGCHSTAYCGFDCQSEHWSTKHQWECALIAGKRGRGEEGAYEDALELEREWFALIKRGDPDAVEQFKRQDHPTFDLDAGDGNGNTALMIAVQSRNVELVRTLLDLGATPSKDAWNRLMLLVTQPGALEIARLMIQAGVDINSRFFLGQTMLMHAAMQSKDPAALQMLKLLVDAGAELDMEDEEGTTAIMHAARGVRNNTASMEAIQYLIRAGANWEDAEYWLPKIPYYHILFRLFIHQDNLNRLSRQLAKLRGGPTRDIWILIIQRAWQEEWCSDFEHRFHSYDLPALAMMLGINHLQFPNNEQLCAALSEFLSLGEIMTEGTLERLRARSDKMKALVERFIDEISHTTAITVEGKTPDEIFRELVQRAKLEW